MNVELVLDIRAELGEGPIWDDARQRLLFVDIMQGRIHQFDPRTQDELVVHVDQPVGAVAPTTRGDWIIAARDGFLRINPATGAETLVYPVEQDEPDNRMNDGYCDARGRFWAGTMSMTRHRGRGALYRLDPTTGRATRMLTNVTTSNGIDWSLDGRLMYYVDTPTQRIDVFDFDIDNGEISNRRPFVTIPDDAGHPDGLIVDSEGCIWLALWGGGAIRRYGADGTLDREIPMPVPHPTKCAFGGPQLTDLYITSASIALSAEARTAYPTAGGLFRCQPGVKGRLPNLYAG